MKAMDKGGISMPFIHGFYSYLDTLLYPLLNPCKNPPLRSCIDKIKHIIIRIIDSILSFFRDLIFIPNTKRIIEIIKIVVKIISLIGGSFQHILSFLKLYIVTILTNLY